MKHQFRNDYSCLAYWHYLNVIKDLNREGQQGAYGHDVHSKNAAEYIKRTFACPNAEVHFLAGGTQTNLAFISYALRPYEAVIAAESGHINVHEAGAIEGTGHKIVTVEPVNGKVTAEAVEKLFAQPIDEHVAVPKMVFISNATETGTIYTANELRALRETCDRHGLYLYVDGARLGYALMSEASDLGPAEFASYCDAFYVGGTKNGMPLGEALVLVNPEFHGRFRNHMKNRGAMLAKTYLIGFFFEEAFTNRLYWDIALETDRIADYLAGCLFGLDIELVGDSPTNQIFVRMEEDKARKVMEEYGCELWEVTPKGWIIRFVVDHTTTAQDVDELIAYLRELIA